MPWQRGATTVPEQAEAIVEQFGGSTNPEGADAARRKLNGKCDPVKPAADPGDDRRIDIAQGDVVAARRRPLHEKLGSRIAQRFHSGQAGIIGWTIE